MGRRSRRTVGLVVVGGAVLVALVVVPVFFSSTTQWAAVTIVAAVGVLALVGLGSPAYARTAAAGTASLLGGVGLFVAFAAVATNSYDEKPRPWWLMSLGAVGVGLVTAGVLAVLLAALGPLRRARS